MYEYRAKIVAVHDGDTVRLDVDLGFSTGLEASFRLAGIDAPELSTPEGKAAREWLRARLPVGSELVVTTQKDRTEKYGRYLAYLRESPDALSINQQLVDAGHAKPWDGRGQRPGIST